MTTTDDPLRQAELAQHLVADQSWVKDLGAEGVQAMAAEMSDEQWRAFSRVIESGVDWRATPATFAHHITKDTVEPYQLWRHSVLMAEQLTRAATGEDPHQIHMVGSQYGKSTLLMWFIIWLLDRDPTLRIMYVSYDADRAVEFGGTCRDLVAKHAGQLRFRLRNDKRARGMWSTPQGGGLYCVGILGGITGFPQEVVLCDDLFKGWQWAHSPTSRETVWRIYTSQVRMRLQSSSGPIIHVGTRWHEDDVQSRLIANAAIDPNADQWTVVRLPTFAEVPDPTSNDPLLRQADPLGRLPGELLCPERFDLKEALARKAALGMYLWASLEQQRPAPVEGNIFKREWWRLDLEDVFTGTADLWVTSWDMKLKQKRTGDYVVGQVWARTGKDLWLVDMVRGQWDQPTVENAVALLMVRYPQIHRHYMENTGNGPEVMDALRTAYPAYVLSPEIIGTLGMTVAEAEAVQRLRRRGMAGIIKVDVRGDKVARALAITGAVQAGDVHIAREKPWLGTFMEEMSNFSGHGDAHDDIVDTLTQAVGKLHRRGRRTRTYVDELTSVRAGV